MFTEESINVDGIRIRPYVPADLARISALIHPLIPKYFAADEADDLRQYLLQERELYFVVERDNAIVASGGINFFPEKGEARISWDMVALDQQGIGIGSALLQYRLSLLESMRQIRRVVVRTSQLAFTFYQKHGFVLKSTEKDYWSEGLDLYLMHRES